MALSGESDSVTGRRDASERSGTPAGNGVRNNYCATRKRGWRGWLARLACRCVGHRTRHDPESDPITVTCVRCGFSQEWYGPVCDGKPFGAQMPYPAPSGPPGFEAPGPWSDPPPLPNGRDLVVPYVVPEGTAIHVHYQDGRWRGFACHNAIGSVEFEHANAAACTRGLLERLREEGGR